MASSSVESAESGKSLSGHIRLDPDPRDCEAVSQSLAVARGGREGVLDWSAADCAKLNFSNRCAGANQGRQLSHEEDMHPGCLLRPLGLGESREDCAGGVKLPAVSTWASRRALFAMSCGSQAHLVREVRQKEIAGGVLVSLGGTDREPAHAGQITRLLLCSSSNSSSEESSPPTWDKHRVPPPRLGCERSQENGIHESPAHEGVPVVVLRPQLRRVLLEDGPAGSSSQRSSSTNCANIPFSSVLVFLGLHEMLSRRGIHGPPTWLTWGARGRGGHVKICSWI